MNANYESQENLDHGGHGFARTSKSASVRTNHSRGADNIIRNSSVRELRAATDGTSLSLPEHLPVEEWTTIGQQIYSMSNSSSWWIGDWIVFGQDKYPDRYRSAIANTSLDYQTLRNYAWIARTFPPIRRRWEVSFQHHMEVAALPADQQDHWLSFAAKFKWSRNELRRQIKTSGEIDTGDRGVAAIPMQLRLEPERLASWRDAAERNAKDLTEWMISILDKAAI